MKKKTIISAAVVIGALVVAGLAFLRTAPPKKTTAPATVPAIPLPTARETTPPKRTATKTTASPLKPAPPADTAEPRPVQPSQAEEDIDEAIDEIAAADPPPRDLKGIKEYIYADEIEYLDDIPVLDELVQVRGKPPEELWGGDWNSVDDWKREQDGFKLEQTETGFTFTTERDGAKEFVYDEETGDFVWEMDYYGKIISQRAKFLTEDTLAMMKISGEKVMVSLYHKGDKGN